MRVAIGLAVTLLGFVLSVLSLGLTSENSARLAIVVLGLAISLTGIIVVLNGHYLRTAIWRNK